MGSHGRIFEPSYYVFYNRLWERRMDEESELSLTRPEGEGARGWSLLQVSSFLTYGLLAQSWRAIDDLEYKWVLDGGEAEKSSMVTSPRRYFKPALSQHHIPTYCSHPGPQLSENRYLER